MPAVERQVRCPVDRQDLARGRSRYRRSAAMAAARPSAPCHLAGDGARQALVNIACVDSPPSAVTTASHNGMEWMEEGKWNGMEWNGMDHRIRTKDCRNGSRWIHLHPSPEERAHRPYQFIQNAARSPELQARPAYRIGPSGHRSPWPHRTRSRVGLGDHRLI